MIELQGVVKSYEGKPRVVDIPALQIKNGEIFGFLGPNGAGKTTTLKMMTGILAPDEGQILLNGFDIVKNPLEAKKQFGFVPDNPDIFLRLKGVEYLSFMADMYDVGMEREERIHHLSETFEMTEALPLRIQNYSHGMRQKIVLMGALIHESPLWLMDEPMTGLDPKSAFTLKNMMRQQADMGKTVLFSTHVLDVAEKICDRVAVIDKGRILFCGTLAELRAQNQSQESLEQIFLQMTHQL